MLELTENNDDMAEPEPLDMWDTVHSMMARTACSTITVRADALTSDQIKLISDNVSVRQRLAKRSFDVALQNRVKKAKQDIEEQV